MTFHDWQVALDRWLSDQWMVGAILAFLVGCWIIGKALTDEPRLDRWKPPPEDPPQ